MNQCDGCRRGLTRTAGGLHKDRFGLTVMACTADRYARGTEDWMCTASGVKYYPAAPRVEDVRIEDIAHHLSRLCRFTGAIIPEHYSVAEHSVLVSQVVPRKHALAGLLHDAPEAYLNDINRPAKRSLPDYKALEARNWAVISYKFGLPLDLPREVHEADVRVFLAEVAAIMPPMPDTHGFEHVTPAAVTIWAHHPEAAKRRFMERFAELAGGR